ncbi:type-F conjugative transfer system secretin TraK [Candidatus Protochlamydia amoebophila]|uniref:Uncharacterized protein n=1 Tax=Protochlamydia amoebophila (strain UWE25) TaxID=264201 RepID=Q6MBA1_PARUW|nr:type-F conjugative transfer system secretin TraK [Candidatus Protochlamydia amoebophila]CAF24148.1 unnamed protein product [Candidatus Protochlamydia amoebophila UWE25]
MKQIFWMGFACLQVLKLSAATYHTLNTTSLLPCYLSSTYQNRVMIENGRIKKVITPESDRLSIQIEELTGQAFIFARDPHLKEISLSVISDSGVIQDIHICFIERQPEVVVLQEPEQKECSPGVPAAEELSILKQVQEIVAGRIPTGYRHKSISSQKRTLKKGIELTLKAKFIGSENTLYLYQLANTGKQPQTVLECEMGSQQSQWIYLEQNMIAPKQTKVCILAVKNHA